MNLTGYAARMQLRPSKTSDIVLLELNTENGGIVLGGVEGTVNLVFTEAMTKPLTKGGVYDVELVVMDAGTSKVTRLVEGAITVSREVTRNG
jgi:hypothetical protein